MQIVREFPTPPLDVLARLRALDPDLGLVWLPLLGCWALTVAWPERDPRRAAAQRGDFDPAKQYDVLTYLPPDCSPHEAAAFVEKHRQTANEKAINEMLAQVDAQNAKAEDANLESATASVMDDVQSIVGRRLTGTASNLDTQKATRKRKGK